MSDFNKVAVTEQLAALYANITDLLKAVAQGLDPASVTIPTNTPTNALQWELTTNKRLQKFNGTSWVTAEPAGGYAINISGSSSKWSTGRTLTFTGAATGVSGAFDGSANISIALTLATVAANKGGTGITGYTVGDLLYASGAAALSKLADVATGNALISGGVGVAPSWGKIGLTTHVSGVLGLANGGTASTTASGARTNLGLAIGTDVMGMGGGTFTGSIAAPNLSGTNTGDEVQATTAVAGKLETSTNAETQAQTSTTVAVTPASLGACTATTTRAGVQENATDVEAAGMALTNKTLTPSNLAALIFESAEQAYPTAGASIAVNHGLGANPASVEAVYRCKAADGGYAVGDEYVVASNYGTISGESNIASAVWHNATQVGVSTRFVGMLTTKSGAGPFAPTAASWRTVLRAKLI